MEYPDNYMEQNNRPSKQFILRGVFAALALGVILVVQTQWFQNLFISKEQQEEKLSSQTVGDLLAKDSNKNGIADWEETLWGLDPKALYTNGVPNKTIIEQKKIALGVTEDTAITPQNETDALARELITIATALGQSGQSDETLSAIGTKMADSVQVQIANNYYSLKDIKTVQTTTENLRNYYQTFSRTAQNYDKNLPEINVLIEGFESGSFDRVPELLQTQTHYEKFAKALITIVVPVGIAYEHLEIVNSVHAMGLSFKYLAQVSENAVNSLAGIALYRVNDQRLSIAGEKIVEYMRRYGILQ